VIVGFGRRRGDRLIVVGGRDEVRELRRDILTVFVMTVVSVEKSVRLVSTGHDRLL
jgi:NADH:ubiquinone oxidoreductase subunit K